MTVNPESTATELAGLLAQVQPAYVVTDAGGLAEAFARYGYGAVVRERTASALAQALRGPYPAAPAAASTNSWSAVAAQTDAIYRGALGG